jgi:dihydroorotase
VDARFDLVIKGGEVLDQPGLRGKRDIGMRYGRIEALEADIPAARANRVMNAAGRIVVPGLIDLHAHVFTSGIGIPADELVLYQGTTTVVSAGDAGASTFATYRRYATAQSRTRIFAFVHIANIGLSAFPVGELFNIDFAQTEAAAKTLAENADFAIGIKVRMSQNVIARHGIEPLRRAIRACELAGTNGRVMCHIGGDGDLMSPPGGAAPETSLRTPSGRRTTRASSQHHQDGRLLPAALEANARRAVESATAAAA